MSTIGEKLTASKNGLTSLLEYANQTTGQSDTGIGEAIRTLCGGYGESSGGLSKNVHDISTDIANTYLESGKLISYNGWSSTDYIPVPDGAVTVATNIILSTYAYCNSFDSEKKYIGIVTREYTIPENVKYIRYSDVTTKINSLKVWMVKER